MTTRDQHATEDFSAERFTGARIRRVEDPQILSGRGRYVDDVRLPGMLHAAFVRSPFAHARITGIDVAEAHDAPGVVAVYTGVELEELVDFVPGGTMAQLGGAPSPVSYTLLATDKVRHTGDPLALVVARSRYEAEDAAELVVVDYDELTPVPDAATALDPSSDRIFDDLDGNVVVAPSTNEYGDVEGAFAAADRVVHAHLDVHRHQHVPMEGRATVCVFDPELGELTVHASTQSVQAVRRSLARQLRLDSRSVHVHARDVGGSFGLKMGLSREEVAVAAVAKDLGGAVKWTEDRNENLIASSQAREESFDVEVAATDDGDLLAMKASMVIDSGSYPSRAGTLAASVQRVIPGPYVMRGLSFESTVVVTNKASYGSYRGPWASETFVRERMVDTVARQLGIEPLELRRRNAVRPTTPVASMVTGPSLAGVTVHEALDRLADLLDVPAFRVRQERARAEGRHLGLGVAAYIESAPGPKPDGGTLGSERVRLRLDDDGTVLVFTGQMASGHGHLTSLMQITADQIGVPFESVRVVAGDSDQVPFGFTGGSRFAPMAGGATLHGARVLRTKIMAAASQLIEASPDDLEIIGNSVQVRGVPASARTLAQIARAARDAPDELEDVDDLEVVHDYAGGEGGWAGGAHAALVEVDVETGLVHIERYVVVEDCGELINPSIVDGQIRGGVAQGIGAVLLERTVYDDQAQCLTGTLIDYLLPTTLDVPSIEIHHLETVPLDPDVHFRGVGEGGMIVAPATICNAIEDALVPFGAEIREQHLPPSRLLELIGAIPAS
ncbi:MAG: xanthine dehydrogenase family protein molybdopterin-binding subunit [Acidimicrobiia bacterium]